MHPVPRYSVIMNMRNTTNKGEKKMTVQMPMRLSWGKGVRGPDFAGCCNSGMAPTILKSREIFRYCDGKAFIVGPSVHIQYGTYEVALSYMRGNFKKFFVKGQSSLRKVRMFKTYAAAKKDFLARCDEVIKANEETQNERRVLAEKVGQGDAGAALGLLDY